MGGGVAQLPGVASITFPANSLANQKVTVSATSSIDTAYKFDVAGEIFNVFGRQPYEVRINVGSTPPASGNYQVTLTLPDDFIAAVVPAGGSIVTFIQIDIDEGINNFDSVESIFTASSKTITLTLPDYAFTTANTSDGTYEAIIVVGIIEPSPIAATSDRKIKRNMWIEGYNSPLIDLLVVTSGFSPRRCIVPYPCAPHKGSDLRAASNTAIIAADDGYVFGRAQLKDYKQPYNYSPENLQGYGYYAIIRHTNGETTLYGHLSKMPPNGPIKKGSKFAESGNSGKGGQFHLHFEFIPFDLISITITDPKLPPGLLRVDPAPFIQVLKQIKDQDNNDTALLNIGQSLQLKAISTNGFSMAEDSDGNPIKLENLKWRWEPENVVIVNDSGLVTAREKGIAIIYAIQTAWSETTAIFTVTVTGASETCTYMYSDWSSCINNTQTRTVISSSPPGCVGTPVLAQTCTPPPTCTNTISPTSQSFGATGGTGSVSVTTSSGCNWTATSNASWLTITSGSSGSGNGTVAYTVAGNTSNSQRTGTMTIAGKIFTVTQAGTTLPTAQTWSIISVSSGQTATAHVDNAGNFTATGWVGNAPGCGTYPIDINNGKMSGTSMTWAMSASYCGGAGTITGSCTGTLDAAFPNATAGAGTCSGTISDPLGTRAFNDTWAATRQQ